jgi:hypothetical protein
MHLPRLRLKVRSLLLLPPLIAILLLAADWLTAKPPRWVYGSAFEFDVVDARDKRPIVASITRTYFGPLAGEDDPTPTIKTLGMAYGRFRGMSRDRWYGGNCCVVKYLPRTLFLHKVDRWVTEGIRFKVEASGYEPFDVVPIDSGGHPLVFNTQNIPVFRVELRPVGKPKVQACWSTRPELEMDTEYLNKLFRSPTSGPTTK